MILLQGVALLGGSLGKSAAGNAGEADLGVQPLLVAVAVLLPLVVRRVGHNLVQRLEQRQHSACHIIHSISPCAHPASTHARDTASITLAGQSRHHIRGCGAPLIMCMTWLRWPQVHSSPRLTLQAPKHGDVRVASQNSSQGS